MKSFIQELIFDKEVVVKLKAAHVNKEYLYNLLFSGKITLQEYLKAEAAAL